MQTTVVDLKVEPELMLMRPTAARGVPLPFPGDAGRQDWAGHLPSPSSECDCWITRIRTAKASDSAFVTIYTISACLRRGTARLELSAERPLAPRRIGVNYQKERT